MKPEDVPAEWVKTAWDAYIEAASHPDMLSAEKVMRDTLAAVIPLIEARERESCRRLSERIAHQFEQDDQRHETAWVVADAIRARGETP